MICSTFMYPSQIPCEQKGTFISACDRGTLVDWGRLFVWIYWHLHIKVGGQLNKGSLKCDSSSHSYWWLLIYCYNSFLSSLKAFHKTFRTWLAQFFSHSAISICQLTHWCWSIAPGSESVCWMGMRSWTQFLHSYRGKLFLYRPCFARKTGQVFPKQLLQSQHHCSLLD